MSRNAAPKYTPPSHGDPIATLLDAETSNYLDNKAAGGVGIWEYIRDRISDICDERLDIIDEYLTDAPESLFDETSVYTGNTRGAIKVTGRYPDNEVEWDMREWERPKTLFNLVPVVKENLYKSKKTGKAKAHRYVYEPGRIKVRITGEDYAPYIPLPDHGWDGEGHRGDKFMLKATYEELRDAYFDGILKKRGLTK